MSKVISTSGLTALRILIRNNSEDIFNNELFKGDSFNFKDISLIDAHEYPGIDTEVLDKFYESYKNDPKNEFELAKILFEAIKIPRNLAANNQYWVYLNLKYFFKYIKHKWIDIEKNDEDFNPTEIDKYFLAIESSQNSLIKSPIAGLWWSLALTVDESLEDKYYYSKIFLSDRNLRDKNLGTYKFVRDKNILTALLDFYSTYKNQKYNDKPIGSEAIAQQMSKTLNQIGGLIVLSYLTKEEIYKLLEENKDLIFSRAQIVQERKKISREKVKGEKNNQNTENLHTVSVIIKYFNISNNGTYCLSDLPKNEYDFTQEIKKEEANADILFCYNESGNINRVKMDSILKKKNNYQYHNGIFIGNTINKIIISKNENDVIGILIEKDNKLFFKAHEVNRLKNNNYNIGSKGIKTVYETYVSIKYFIVDPNLKEVLKKLIFRDFSERPVEVNHNNYEAEWIALKNSYSNYFPD
jgi:hypothetical protein